MFDALRGALEHRRPLGKIGFTVADSWFYGKWLEERPDFERGGDSILKEWEVTRRRQGKPDLAKLAGYERQLDARAGLFGALVADRRLFMGKDCSYSQDYRRRFSDDELLCILQAGLEEMDRLFDMLKPDLLVGFICVTMLDYLAYLFAKARGVRVLNLRPTRVGDRVMFGSLLNDPDPAFVNALARIYAGEGGDLALARQHLRRVREEHGRYEGVVRPSDKPVLGMRSRRRGLLGSALGAARNYLEYRRSEARTDNHVPNPLRSLLFTGLINPLRARVAARRLASRYVDKAGLRGKRYAFFPLHTEPEVSLLVYGRPFVNQIEVIRALAMSLPVDMVLVVKEHPWMVGKRNLGTYQKLLNIPRVRIARPNLDARDLVLGAELVAVVTGSVALEAAMLGKPVVTFGDCPYNALPSHMVRRCVDLRLFPEFIRSMLEGYRSDEAALEAYIAAVIETSERVNLYSVLLGKRGVYAERSADYQAEVEKLAGYLQRCLDMPEVVASSPDKAAAW